MPKVIDDSGHATKDSREVFTYLFDYDDEETLVAGVELASVGAVTITPSGLTQSNQVLLTGNRQFQVLIAGGVVGRTYTIEHTVQTNENPAQTFNPWFKLRIT